MELKKCVICGKEKEYKVKPPRYICSDVCKSIDRFNQKGINYLDLHECKICGVRFSQPALHLKNKHNITVEEYCTLYNFTRDEITYKDPKNKKVCVICEKEYYNTSYQSRTCSKECKEELYDKEHKPKFFSEKIECLICGRMVYSIKNHMQAHKDWTFDKYKEHFNLNNNDLFSNEYKKFMSERVKGDKNPGHQHNGKFSSVSKNFKNYDNLSEEEVNISIKKVKDKIIYSKHNGGWSTNQKEYWLDRGYTEEESIKKVSERQTTFSKEICIEKYGELEGLKRWQQRQEKWFKNYKKSNFSKISQDLFWKVYANLDKKLTINFAQLLKGKKDDSGKNHEYTISNSLITCKPDFIIHECNIILEFDGSYWHSDQVANIGRERKRDNALLTLGYKVLHVKENDYRKNPEKVINKCLEFINENIKQDKIEVTRKAIRRGNLFQM